MSADTTAPPILAAFRDALREHALLAAIVGVYVAVAWAVAKILGVPFQVVPNFRLYTLLLAVTLLFAFCWHAVSVMVLVRPDHPIRYMIASVKAHMAPSRLAFAAPALVLIPVFASAFTFMKASIPALNPYSWDADFTRWDQALHGGFHPWVLLQPALGHPLVTGGFSFAYQLWFFVMYGVLALQAFETRRRALRMRLLLSFVLSWIILGTVGAIAFASMGPCYDPALSHNDGAYAPLMAYLREAGQVVTVWALDVQKMLWESHIQNKVGLGSGISAMPSMHVATMALISLFGWQYSRLAGFVLTSYAVVIMIGSVHLAWHYAIDGYAGALGAWCIWALVGRWQQSTGKVTESEFRLG